MNPTIEEQFNIIRRILERGKADMFKNGHDQYVDILNHLDDEFAFLKTLITNA